MKKFALFCATLFVAIVAAVAVRAGPDNVKFPVNYAKGVLYHTVDRADNKQFRELFITKFAAEEAKAGRPLPSGTVITMVNYKAKLGADGQPEKDGNGRFIKTDEIAAIAVMEKRMGWGRSIRPTCATANGNTASSRTTAPSTTRPTSRRASHATSIRCGTRTSYSPWPRSRR